MQTATSNTEHFVHQEYLKVLELQYKAKDYLNLKIFIQNQDVYYLFWERGSSPYICGREHRTFANGFRLLALTTIILTHAKINDAVQTYQGDKKIT